MVILRRRAQLAEERWGWSGSGVIRSVDAQIGTRGAGCRRYF
jgi:hypothetical protein